MARKRKTASASDLAEIARGKGSARDRAEAGRGKRKKRIPKKFKIRTISRGR